MKGAGAPEREAERALVLQLLREDRPRRWSRGGLERVLRHLTPVTIQSALWSLAEAGAVELDGDDVWASPAAQRIDELGLIAI